MFGFFSKNKEGKKNLLSKDSQAENILIHTMTKDLESLGQQPGLENKKFPESVPLLVKKSGFNGLSEQQKTSPFLNKPEAPTLPTPPVPKPKLEGFTKPISGPLLEDQEFFDGKPGNIFEIKEDALPVRTNDGRKKLILALIIILIITTALTGGYYFWSTRNNVPPENVAVETTDEERSSENISEEESNSGEQPTPAFSATEKNYFMLDMSSNALVSFRGMIKSYYEKVVASKISYPVEFTVINQENVPVDFKTFTQTLGIKLSSKILSTIEDDFNLYIYNDQGNPGVGLAVKVRGEMNPEDILLKEEKSLPAEIESLFPVDQYTIKKGVVFATSEHSSVSWGKIDIRFLNIISPENLSVDYAFVNTGMDMLFMGTTRATLRSIIDTAKPSVVSP